MDAILTVAEVAERLKCSKRFVLRELARKQMRGSNTPAGWRVTEADFETYLDSLANVGRVRGRSA